MKKVSLTVNGKSYEKVNPTVKDWFDQQEMLITTQGKNIITDKESGESVIQAVALFLGITVEEIIKANIDLEELIKAYQTIQANIIECFIKPNALKAKKDETKAD